MLTPLVKTPSWTTSDLKIHTNYLVALKHEVMLYLTKAGDNEVCAKKIAESFDEESVRGLMGFLSLIDHEFKAPTAFEVIESEKTSGRTFETTPIDSSEMLLATVNPEHPGGIMNAIIGGLGLTVSDAEVMISEPSGILHGIINLKHPVTMKMAMKFEAAFGGPDPLTIHAMSDAYESKLIMKQRDEIVKGINRYNQTVRTQPLQ